DDAGWSALTGPSGFGTDQAVWTLQTYDDGNGIALYVSGLMSTAGGVEVDRIAKWDGSIWSDLALSDFDREGNKLISTMSVFDGGDGPSLITGGFFIRIGGFEGVFGAAGWDGKKWSPLIGQDGVGVSR